jgi:thiamine monophosphate synthase
MLYFVKPQNFMKNLADFIINDNVYLAQQIAADGVHLGLTDMSIKEAQHFRDLKIIRATVQLLLILKTRTKWLRL